MKDEIEHKRITVDVHGKQIEGGSSYGAVVCSCRDYSCPKMAKWVKQYNAK